MKPINKRPLSLLLSVTMLFSMTGMSTVFATEGDTTPGASNVQDTGTPCGHLLEDGTYRCDPAADAAYLCPHEDECGYVAAEGATALAIAATLQKQDKATTTDSGLVFKAGEAQTGTGYDWDGSTLTLNNFTYTATNAAAAITLPYVTDGVTLVLKGNNTLQGGDNPLVTGLSGLVCDGSLTITSDTGGKLTAIGGSGTFNKEGGHGLQTTYGLTVKGNATVTGRGAAGTKVGGNGIFVQADMLVENGTVTATSADADGIHVHTGVYQQNDGTVTATGGKNGIYIDADDYIQNGGTVTATGGQYGIWASGNIMVEEGSSLTANAGNAGLALHGGAFNLNGGYIHVPTSAFSNEAPTGDLVDALPPGTDPDWWKGPYTLGTPVPVTGISVTPERWPLYPGETLTLEYEVLPANATNKAVTFESGDTAVATVDDNGKVTAIALGDATITVTTEDGNFKATCAVIVTGKPNGYDIDEENFPDKAFREWIAANVDTVKDGVLTLDEIGEVKSIDVSFKGIASLKGIEYFTNLEILYCHNNRLTELPALPAGLTELNCIGNQLTALPALPAGLTDLDCNNNLLTALPELPEYLTKLACEYNQLATLPALPEHLTTLICNNNRLTALPKLPDGLIELHCNSNQITGLPTPLPTGLKNLYCNQNRLESLDLSGPAKLNPPTLRYNYMTENPVPGNEDAFKPQHTDKAFKAVTGIVDVPYQVASGDTLTLTGNVWPADATNKTITWSVFLDGNTGATIDGNKLTAQNPGMVVVVATVVDGNYNGADDTVSQDSRNYQQPLYVWVTGDAQPSKPAPDYDDNDDGGPSGRVSGGASSTKIAALTTLPLSANVKPDGSVDPAKAAADAQKAMEEAKKNGTAPVVKIDNAKTIDPATAKAYADAIKAAGGSKGTLWANTTDAKGNVLGRLHLDPALVAKLEKPIQLGIHTDPAAIQQTKNIFQKYFENKIAVISLDQKGSFGMNVQMAVKVDLTGLDTKALKLYSYDKAKNQYTALPAAACRVDNNGLLWFITSLGDDIIVIGDASLRPIR